MFNLAQLAIILLIIGGLNCGSIGVLGKDFISSTLGRGMAAKVLHIAIGLSAVFVALRFFGLMEGFENNNMNKNMNMNMNMNNAEGFNACKDGKDAMGKPCA